MTKQLSENFSQKHISMLTQIVETDWFSLKVKVQQIEDEIKGGDSQMESAEHGDNFPKNDQISAQQRGKDNSNSTSGRFQKRLTSESLVSPQNDLKIALTEDQSS